MSILGATSISMLSLLPAGVDARLANFACRRDWPQVTHICRKHPVYLAQAAIHTTPQRAGLFACRAGVVIPSSRVATHYSLWRSVRRCQSQALWGCLQAAPANQHIRGSWGAAECVTSQPPANRQPSAFAPKQRALPPPQTPTSIAQFHPHTLFVSSVIPFCLFLQRRSWQQICPASVVESKCWQQTTNIQAQGAFIHHQHHNHSVSHIRHSSTNPSDAVAAALGGGPRTASSTNCRRRAAACLLSHVDQLPIKGGATYPARH